MILYGISTCDTCKKALKAIQASGHDVEFRDVRADPLSADEIGDLVTAFGDAVVNRASTTWRGLSDWLKASDAEEQLAAQLCTASMPDPELLIRTSGEQRISNFLLWQIAYAELWFTPLLWPDFRKAHLFQAVLDFQNRERRFGLISEQVTPG